MAFEGFFIQELLMDIEAVRARFILDDFEHNAAFLLAGQGDVPR